MSDLLTDNRSAATGGSAEISAKPKSPDDSTPVTTAALNDALSKLFSKFNKTLSDKLKKAIDPISSNLSELTKQYKTLNLNYTKLEESVTALGETINLQAPSTSQVTNDVFR